MYKKLAGTFFFVVLIVCVFLLGFGIGKQAPRYIDVDISQVEPGDTIVSDFGVFAYNVVLEVKDNIARVDKRLYWGNYEDIIRLDYHLERGFLHKRKK